MKILFGIWLIFGVMYCQDAFAQTVSTTVRVDVFRNSLLTKTWYPPLVSSGTLATVSGTEIFTNKTLVGAVLSGTTINQGVVSGGQIFTSSLSGTITNLGIVSGGVVREVSLLDSVLGNNTNSGTLLNTGTVSGGTLLNNSISSATISNSSLSGVSLLNGSSASNSVVMGDSSRGLSLVASATAFASLSPLTTKGDILTYNGGNTRLGVGVDAQVLTASSTTTTGLAWSNVAAGSLNVSSTTVNTTLTIANDVLLASGAVTVTLPSAASQTGKVITIKNVSTKPTNQGASNSVVLIQSVSSQLIDGVSASTSLVNFGESVDLVSNGSTWYYKNESARIRKFGVNYGGVSEFVQCGTNPCRLYQNTGAVSAVLNPGATTGLYTIDLLRQTCRTRAMCTIIVSDLTNYITPIPLNTSSSTAYTFSTGVTAANNTWGSVVCYCDRW